MSWRKSTIKFECFSLAFEAEVKLYPGYPGSREQPPEGPELEFVTLTCEGRDAFFLLGSEFMLEKLDEAAWDIINSEAEPDYDGYEPEDLEP